MKKKFDAWLVALCVFSVCSSASAAGDGDGSVSVQDLQQEIAQLQTQLQQLQAQQASAGTSVTVPSGGGSFNYPNQINLNWSSYNNSYNNGSGSATENGSSGLNISTVYQLQSGYWNFQAPDVNGYWNAQFNFNGTETPNTTSFPNGTSFGSNSNINVRGLQVGKSNYTYSEPYMNSGSSVWTGMNANLNVSPSLILSSNLSFYENPDWNNPSVTDFRARTTCPANCTPPVFL